MKASEIAAKREGTKTQADLIVESLTDFPLLNTIPTCRVDATVMPIASRNLSSRDTRMFINSLSNFEFHSCHIADTLKITFIPFKKAEIYNIRVDFLMTQHIFQTNNKTIYREKVPCYEKTNEEVKPLETKRREVVLI